MDDLRTIHLQVPAAQKAAWVAESRAAGQRLGPWLLARMRRPAHLVATPAELREWLARMGYTQQQAATLLCVRRATVAEWLAGKLPIERRTTLALAAVEAGLTQMFAHQATTNISHAAAAQAGT